MQGSGYRVSDTGEDTGFRTQGLEYMVSDAGENTGI